MGGNDNFAVTENKKTDFSFTLRNVDILRLSALLAASLKVSVANPSLTSTMSAMSTCTLFSSSSDTSGVPPASPETGVVGVEDRCRWYSRFRFFFPDPFEKKKLVADADT